MSDHILPDNCQHHGFYTGCSQVLRRLVHLVFQHILHNENDVLDELCVDIGHDDLSLLVKEFLYDYFDLVEKNWVKGRSHLMTNELLYVLLNLRPKLFIGTDEESKELAYKLGHRAVLHVLLRSKDT